MRYVLLTPQKNEQQYIEQTLRSVCAQTILPKRWIILDDNSTDSSPELIRQYQQQHPWIEFIIMRDFRPDLNSTGGRSGALMNYARELIQDETVDFVVKIDADVAFAPDFFATVFQHFAENPKLGLASGHLRQDGIPETLHDWTGVRGATRIYRRTCFEQIGKFYTMRGEDEIDTFLAQQKGWLTRTLPVPFDHLKPEGIRSPSLVNHFDTGRFKAQIPYRFDFFMLTVLKNVRQKPFVLGAAMQLFAYVKTRWVKAERPFPPELGRHVQQRQWRKMRGVFSRNKSAD
ncbi:glycosyltransferase [Tellurirhabdus rosea]|uniref:glycosyltransferase n=1 Tax=Tellurirhabdus rosea TaxID=2674997 RepID=UPI002250D830|nr:glycosyltransferase family A protein [Tellurirhabdus rosea]